MYKGYKSDWVPIEFSDGKMMTIPRWVLVRYKWMSTLIKMANIKVFLPEERRETEV